MGAFDANQGQLTWFIHVEDANQELKASHGNTLRLWGELLEIYKAFF